MAKVRHVDVLERDEEEDEEAVDLSVVTGSESSLNIPNISNISHLPDDPGEETEEGGDMEAEEEEERRHAEGGVHPVLQLLHKETLPGAIP